VTSSAGSEILEATSFDVEILVWPASSVPASCRCHSVRDGRRQPSTARNRGNLKNLEDILRIGLMRFRKTRRRFVVDFRRRRTMY